MLVATRRRRQHRRRSRAQPRRIRADGEDRDAIAGRVPLVAGIIANSTAEVAARGDLVSGPQRAFQVTPPSYLFRPTTTPWSNTSAIFTLPAGCRS